MAADPRLGLAQKYVLFGLYDDAWQTLQDVLPESEGDVAAFRLAATIQVAREKYKSAIVFCRKALAIDASDHETQFNLALALEKTGELEPAAEVYRRALALNDMHAVTWNNLGGVLDRLGRSNDAIAAYEQALVIAPDDASARNNLGVCLLGQGQYAAARYQFQCALATNPSDVSALVNLGVTLVEMGDVEAGQTCFDRAIAYAPDHRDAWDNKLFALHYISDAPQDFITVHRDWGQRYPSKALAAHDRSPSRKLRVGYVSPDFKRHSVAFFAEPLISAHNKDAVEVFCYANSATRDAVTARFEVAADHWRNVFALDTAAALDLIRTDQIDILVDLAGHTVGNRLDIFTARAAPVQITAIGYPNTTGLPTMDARLVDAQTDPQPMADAWSTERLIRLPQLHCYAPIADAPPVGALPVLSGGHITFGSFNKRAKISTETVRMWAAILRAVPQSRLFLKTKVLADDAVRAQLTATFQAQGITPDRLDLRGWSATDADHLDLYNAVDIALDTYPYNGTTTTCEALWMGVPVLTRVGQCHAARVGASLLGAVGLSGCVAETADAYISEAVKLAADTKALALLRAGLRGQVTASALCQPKAYAASVEVAYRNLWAAFCAR